MYINKGIYNILTYMLFVFSENKLSRMENKFLCIHLTKELAWNFVLHKHKNIKKMNQWKEE